MKGTLIFTLALLLGLAGFLTTGFAQTYAHHDTLNEGTGLARALAFSPNGTLLASGGGRNVYLHDPGTGMLERTLRGHTDTVMVVAFSPDGNMLASASGDRTIRLWNPLTGRLIRTLRGHTNQIYAMAFSRTGQLASGGRDNTVRLWNTQTGTNRIIGRHGGWVLSVAFSSTGLLASSGRDNTIRIWNATTGAPLGALIGHTNFVTSVAFTATGDTLVSGSRDNTLRIWNAATGGAALKTLQGHTDWVNSVAVSANGTIASAGADETARLSDPATGQRIATFNEHTDSVRVVAFSRDGQWLASGSGDGTVQLWQRSGPDETQVVVPPVETQPIHIPDAELAADLRKHLGLGEGAVITAAEMRELTQLYPSTSGLTDLTGLEHATQLKTLGLSYTAVSDISALATLTQLETLELRDTAVSDISALATLTNLKTLELRDTAVSDISALATLTQLETLSLYDTAVSDISVLANLTNLKTLGLSYTAVSDISALATLTNLKTLSFNNTAVSDISALATLTNLKTLRLRDTGVSDISVLANLTQLETLNLRRCPLSPASRHTHIPALQAKGIKVYFDEQGDSLIPDGNLAVAIREALQLGEGAPIPAAAMRQLTELSASGTFSPESRRVVGLTGLQHATQLKTLYLNNTAVSDISVLANLTKLKELWVDTSAVSDISALATLTQLETLSFSDTAVSDISVLANLTKLKTLELSYTAVSDISVLANLTKLETLELENTAVSDISVLANLTQLETLNLRRCPLSPASRHTHIPALQAKGIKVYFDNDVIYIPDTNLANAIRETLRLDEGIPITATAMSGIWWHFSASNRGVQNLTGLQHATQLPGLYLNNTGVSDISVLANLTQLETLDLSDTGVSDISALGNLTKLKELRLLGCWLNHASLYTHIPALEAKGVVVKFEYPVGCGTLMPSYLEPLRPVRIEPVTRKKEIVPEGDFQGATVKFTPVGSGLAWTPDKTIANDEGTGSVVISVSISNAFTAAQKRTIKRAATEWMRYGNFIFRFVNGEADVPISMGSGEGNFGSATVGGVDHRAVKRGKAAPASMKLSNGFSYGVCLHEFGHVLGLSHEQVSPKFKEFVDWAFEEEKLIPKLKTHGRQDWTDEQIRHNILSVREVGEGAKFDPDSIMVYNMNKGLVKARPDAPDPTLANKIAAEGIDIDYDRGLSDDDKGLIRHLYGSPTPKVFVKGSISIEGVDDETGKFKWKAVKVLGVPVAPKLVQVSDEKINESKGFGPQLFSSVDEYVLSSADPVAAFRWGGECRVQVYLSSRKIVAGSHIEMAANVFLFEGASEDTTDLEDFKCVDFDIPLTGSEEEVTLKLENKFWRDEPWWIIDVRARTCRSIDIELDTSTLSFKGDVLGGGDWAEVTLSLSAGTFDAETDVEDLLAAAAPSAATVKHRPSEEISDVNGDGRVTVADLVLVSNHIGQTDPSDSRVDLNADGIVTIVDLVQVAQHLGSSTDPAAPAHIVAPKGLAYETVEGWLAGARAADDGSRLFLQGITNLERLLLLIIPEETVLLHNYPNPFNPETWIPYHLAEAAEVTLTIYAVDGTVVRTLALGHQSAGFYQSRSRAAYWDGRNAAGEPVASGVYFYTLRAGDFSATRKMVIRK